MNLIEAFDVLHKMATIQRYSQTRLINPESVLEHTGFVAILAGLMADECGYDPGAKLKLLEEALVHDIDEIITGDIPRPTKYYNKGVTDALEGVADSNMQEISLTLYGNLQLYHIWRAHKHNIVLQIADKLAVVYKIWQEVELHGNRNLLPHITSIKAYLIERRDRQEMNPKFQNIITQGIEICLRIETYE